MSKKFTTNYNPLVSILIPNFNSDKYIQQAIDSAINQTYNNIEIVVVDNQSTDDSWKLIKEKAATDSRIRIFQNGTNVGPVKNWLRCIEYAKGELAKIIWSDDYISTTYIEKTIPYLKDFSIGFVITKTIHFDEINQQTRFLYEIGETGCYSMKNFQTGVLLRSDYPKSPGCAIFRLSDVKNNLLLNVPNKINSDFSKHAIGNDLLIFLLTSVNYPKFGYLNESLATFRAHDLSITTSSKSEKIDLLYDVAKAYFVENYINDVRIIRCFNTTLLFSLFKHKGNTLGLRNISDFYLHSRNNRISYSYIFGRLLKSFISSVRKRITFK